MFVEKFQNKKKLNSKSPSTLLILVCQVEWEGRDCLSVLKVASTTMYSYSNYLFTISQWMTLKNERKIDDHDHDHHDGLIHSYILSMFKIFCCVQKIFF